MSHISCDREDEAVSDWWYFSTVTTLFFYLFTACDPPFQIHTSLLYILDSSRVVTHMLELLINPLTSSMKWRVVLLLLLLQTSEPRRMWVQVCRSELHIKHLHIVPYMTQTHELLSPLIIDPIKWDEYRHFQSVNKLLQFNSFNELRGVTMMKTPQWLISDLYFLERKRHILKCYLKYFININAPKLTPFALS